MKRALLDVENRQSFTGTALCSLPDGCMVLQRGTKAVFTTSPHQEEYHMLLQIGGCLDLAMSHKDEPGKPYVLSGRMGLEWISEWVHLQNGGHLLVILGPIFMKNSSVDRSLQRLDRTGVSQHLRRQYLNVLSDVPVLSWEAVRQYAAMLHFTAYEENMEFDSLQLETQQEPERSQRETTTH